MAASNDGQKIIITGTAQQTHEMVAELFPNAIPLVKRDAIYLIPIGHGDDQRFARNFRTAAACDLPDAASLGEERAIAKP